MTLLRLRGGLGVELWSSEMLGSGGSCERLKRRVESCNSAGRRGAASSSVVAASRSLLLLASIPWVSDECDSFEGFGGLSGLSSGVKG